MDKQREAKRRAKRATAVGVLAALGAAVIGAPAAVADTPPTFSECPTGNPSVTTCINVLSNSGDLAIKGFDVPLDHSLAIKGGLIPGDGGAFTFVPPAGTNGFFAQPVNVPGGLLGIDLPIGINKVTATAELAHNGPIQVNVGTLTLQVPVRLKLSNPLLASGCQIGSDADPVNLDLITGTTSPPPPNQPITGSPGTPSIIGNALEIADAINVDNSFAVPGASGCGYLGLGLIDRLVDLRLKLPSAAGNNAIGIDNTVWIEAASDVRRGGA